jgi:hypothetical protein
VKRVLLTDYCASLSTASTCALVAFQHHWLVLMVLVRGLVWGVSACNNMTGDGVAATLGGATTVRVTLGIVATGGSNLVGAPVIR